MMTHPYPTIVAPASADCGCGSRFPCPPSECSGVERTRFFPRQLVTPDDLTQDQLYFGDKFLRHNRLLHGWGVVCGARVMKHAADKCKVVVEAGYVLGPWGHEILIDRDVEVDLCHEGIDGNSVSPCGPGSDPWCSDISVSRPAGKPLYIAVKYAECEARPVRAQGHSCGCQETDCEYSRIRDSFAVRVLEDLPSTYTDPMPQPSSDNLIRCAVDAKGEPVPRVCPTCPAEPWVVLADVVLKDDGDVLSIDCFAHRRYVVSFADFYYLCGARGRVDDYRAVVLNKMLVDQQAAAPAPGTTEQPPKAIVALARFDGSTTYLPVHFDIRAGETLGSLIAREGKREYLDPDTN